jgi:Family of unknown function (DUF5317)
VKYILWIGIVFSLVEVALGNNPLWPALLLTGLAANGLVIAVNGWKMPVRGRGEEGIRHTAMTSATRLRWLGDIIPVGLGIASIGDFLLIAGMLGIWANRSRNYAEAVALCALGLWVVGWSRGFNLFGKWTVEERKDTKKNIPIVILLMIAGNLMHARGCSVGELQASAKDVETALASKEVAGVEIKPAPKWRNLGKLAAPPPQMLRRMREDTAKQEQKNRENVTKVFSQPLTHSVAVVNGNMFIARSQPTAKSGRSGPFCRVTCAAHHGGEYDVETLPEACKANWIPPTAIFVPGWYAVSDKEEVASDWPGPAEKGFSSYKLYWSDLQSAAKVVHASGTSSENK